MPSAKSGAAASGNAPSYAGPLEAGKVTTAAARPGQRDRNEWTDPPVDRSVAEHDGNKCADENLTQTSRRRPVGSVGPPSVCDQRRGDHCANSCETGENYIDGPEVELRRNAQNQRIALRFIHSEPLSLPGLAAQRSRRDDVMLRALIGVGAIGLVVPMLFFGDPRFKVATTPVFVVFAGLAIAEAAQHWSDHRRNSHEGPPGTAT